MCLIFFFILKKGIRSIWQTQNNQLEYIVGSYSKHTFYQMETGLMDRRTGAITTCKILWMNLHHKNVQIPCKISQCIGSLENYVDNFIEQTYLADINKIRFLQIHV